MIALDRRLGSLGAAAIVVSNVIGGGIFFVPILVAPRFRAPVTAIVAQSIWSGVLVLSGTLAQLVSYIGFSLVLFSGVAVTALFVLRRREPDAPRPFRAWGYPCAPGIFVVACAVMVANELWHKPGTSAAGVAIIAAGIPVYGWLTRWSPATPTTSRVPAGRR